VADNFTHLEDDQVLKLLTEEIGRNPRLQDLLLEHCNRLKMHVVETMSKLRPPVDHSYVERNLGVMNMLDRLLNIAKSNQPN